jgi:hypothetical protein
VKEEVIYSMVSICLSESYIMLERGAIRRWRRRRR